MLLRKGWVRFGFIKPSWYRVSGYWIPQCGVLRSPKDGTLRGISSCYHRSWYGGPYIGLARGDQRTALHLRLEFFFRPLGSLGGSRYLAFFFYIFYFKHLFATVCSFNSRSIATYISMLVLVIQITIRAASFVAFWKNFLSLSLY